VNSELALTIRKRLSKATREITEFAAPYGFAVAASIRNRMNGIDTALNTADSETMSIINAAAKLSKTEAFSKLSEDGKVSLVC
jgi:hypothetical protein